MKPAGLCAIRSVNQYRRRDIHTYLALRYYFESSSSRSDNWAHRVAVRSTTARSTPGYYGSYYLKEVSDDGSVKHRRLWLPGAQEALAEAALLRMCENMGGAFTNHPRVFSYQLAPPDYTGGMFAHFMDGIRARHEAVGAVCGADPECTVIYTDIERFYPSISMERANAAWTDACSKSDLPRELCQLGMKLLSDHATGGEWGDNSILTGPMFSHLMGNLVLRSFDERASSVRGVEYFRYVDDLILVGPPKTVQEALAVITDDLASLGFQTHASESQKCFEVSSREWLDGKDDFKKGKHKSWASLIGDLKRYLLVNPDDRSDLDRMLRDRGMRLPLMDYSEAVREQPYLRRLRELVRLKWLPRTHQKVTPKALVERASHLRQVYANELEDLAEDYTRVQGYSRKRLVAPMRFYAGRLTYLQPVNELRGTSNMLHGIKELAFHSAVMQALISGNVTEVLEMGGNVAQAAAQVLRLEERRAYSTTTDWRPWNLDALSVFLFNGVDVQHPGDQSPFNSDIVRLANGDVDARMMMSGNRFVREFACLRGVTDAVPYETFLESAFAVDEDLAMDAVDQLQESGCS